MQIIYTNSQSSKMAIKLMKDKEKQESSSSKNSSKNARLFKKIWPCEKCEGNSNYNDNNNNSFNNPRSW